MNQELFKKYRALYEQCFVPIFVRDGYDTETLLRGAELAGVKVIEYTLRREDAHLVIPSLKQKFPAFTVCTGSNIDSEKIIRNMKRLHPQLMTMGEMAPWADGFVSMLPFTDATIEKYADSHILIPSAATPDEALRQVIAGAAFIKMSGGNLDAVKLAKAAPTFGYCPLFVTGGVTPERMEAVYKAGACLTASGFDLILKGIDPAALTPELAAEKIRCFVSTAKAARAAAYPQLAELETLSDARFLQALPHYHPF